MVEYYVVSKSEGWRVHCTGPLTAQVEMGKLVEKEGKNPDDLRIEMVVEKKPLPRARTSAARKRNWK